MVVATGVVDLWSVLPIGYELVLLNAVIMGVLIIVIGVMAGSLRGKEPWKSVKVHHQPTLFIIITADCRVVTAVPRPRHGHLGQ